MHSEWLSRSQGAGLVLLADADGEALVRKEGSLCLFADTPCPSFLVSGGSLKTPDGKNRRAFVRYRLQLVSAVSVAGDAAATYPALGSGRGCVASRSFSRRSPIGKARIFRLFYWSGRRDSNPRPRVRSNEYRHARWSRLTIAVSFCSIALLQTSTAVERLRAMVPIARERVPRLSRTTRRNHVPHRTHGQDQCETAAADRE